MKNNAVIKGLTGDSAGRETDKISDRDRRCIVKQTGLNRPESSCDLDMQVAITFDVDSGWCKQVRHRALLWCFRWIIRVNRRQDRLHRLNWQCRDSQHEHG